MENCIFCKIIKKEIPADIIFETPEVLAFKDLNPQAPIHFLVIPKKHISTINDLTPEDADIIGKMLLETANYAKRENFAESGYRTVFNCNKDACQSVFHIHLHVMAGRQMGWPPG